MNARFRHPSAAPGATAPAAVPPGPGDQACCCVARAVVRVVMASSPDRPHETELLLCGHHYRVSRRALSAAHAQVYELPGACADPTAWYHDDHDRSTQTVVAAGQRRDPGPGGAGFRP